MAEAYLVWQLLLRIGQKYFYIRQIQRIATVVLSQPPMLLNLYCRAVTLPKAPAASS
jgi:hypothetical protein